MGNEWKPEPLGRINRVIGAIPYSVVCDIGIEHQQKNRYRVTRESFYIRVELKSLDWIRKFRFFLGAPWIHRIKKAGSFVHWSSDEGWWIEDGITGRRTRPMPKFLAAILGVTLIVVSPELLQIAFTHASQVQKPGIVYGVLCLVLFLLVSMIAFYIWVGHKSRPTGFEEILKQFGRSLGKKEDGETTNMSSDVSSGKET